MKYIDTGYLIILKDNPLQSFVIYRTTDMTKQTEVFSY